MRIFLISGEAQSGKDSVADIMMGVNKEANKGGVNEEANLRRS